MRNKIIENAIDSVVNASNTSSDFKLAFRQYVKNKFDDNAKAFSYTHLDVYKRQSVDGDMKFVPADSNENAGILEIDMTASFLINDGQHRKAAIEAAIAEDESLKEETISIVLYKDQGLQRSQQMFTDLNKHAVTTSKSLNTLYESKDPVALITKNVVNSISFLRKYTDKEKDNLSKYSSNIFTLNTFYTANKRICKAVSYTHLDVYKRQTLHSSRSVSASGSL